MSLGIEEEEWEQTETRRDTELSISPLMLLGAAACLILLCSLCFGIGYATGRHYSNEPSSAIINTATQTTAPTGGVTSKPMASRQAETQTADVVATDASASTTAADTPAAPTPVENGSALQPRAKPVEESAIRSALPPITNAAQPVITKPVQSALSPGESFMVQIAAVSRPEDADVLVNALRRRGYAVVVSRGGSDSLTHVQIGPLANRNQANAVRQKLLNDGYNAVVQP